MPDRPQVIILHIDDNEANRYVVTRMLQNAGFDVKQAATGETGVQIALEQQPDLIVLDVQLPDINGFEVCRRLKASPATAFIPVLHLSASFVKSEDKVQGLDSGADGYLAQPVEPIELVATVNALLRTRQAEEAARLLAREWQTTFNAIADGVCMLDTNGTIMQSNLAASELWEKPESEIKGSFYGDLMPDLLSFKENPFIRARETCRRQNLELRFGDRWFSVTADPILGDRGNFAGAVWIVADITDRKQAESAQRETEERFRLLLDNAQDYAIFFLDAQGYIIRWSVGAQRILGYEEAEALGQPTSIIFTPEDLAAGTDKLELEQALAKGQAEDERWHIRKDGTRFWASGIVTSLKDEAGLRGFAKIMRDFTERKQAEDERAQLLVREQNARTQAETANRMKDEFLATLSHELRSPLNAMLGWLRLLNTRKFDEKTTAKAMETIERSARAQAQLVEDLLDVSRIIQGKVRLNVRPVELVTVIEAALDTVRPAAEAKEIRLQTIFDSTGGLVAGDSDRLQQIVWNLLSNAVKFTLKGGQVQVCLERVNSHVEIAVSDTGLGIKPEFLPFVFDRFRQADSSIARTYTGLGIGLAIVRHLVELHGGSVRAQSEGEGKGATFTIKLPLMPVRQNLEAGERVHPGIGGELPFENLPALNGLRVLVVDDEADSRAFLTAVLEECGAEVVAVGSVVEAIATLKSLKPDILLSDIGMPEEDGYALIRQVRSLSPQEGGQIPAAALTAYARAEDRTRSLLSGFQIHLPKPIEPAELAAVVANLANRTG